jgi:threonine dehydratase
MLRFLLIALLAAGQMSAADLIAKASASLTTNTTWGVVEAGASATLTTKSSNTNTTTSYVYSSAFTCTNSDVIDGMLLHTKQVIEPTAALGPAVLAAGLLPADVRRVGVVLCGGNIDPAVLSPLWG